MTERDRETDRERGTEREREIESVRDSYDLATKDCLFVSLEALRKQLFIHDGTISCLPGVEPVLSSG